MVEVEKYIQDRFHVVSERLFLLEHDQERLERKISETATVLTKLERDAESGIQAFSPREMDEKRKIQMEQLQVEQEKRKKELERCMEQIPVLQKEKEELQKVLYAYQKEKEQNNALQSEYEEKMKRKILEAQENERKRIAAELHDQSVQDLTSMVHKIELCSKLIQMDPIRCKLELMAMSNAIKGIIEEMRKMIYDLRPMTFDDIGFETTVERALEKMLWKSEVKFILTCDKNVNTMDQVVLITLLRIIMEACNNVLKYANASRIQVTIKDFKTYIEMEIIDDGNGFDVQQTFAKSRQDNTGFGLQIMKERVALLSGTIDFQSTVGLGTTIVVKVPVCKEVE